MHIELSQNDFKELSKEVKKVLGKPSWVNSYGMEWVKMALKALLFSSGFLLFLLPHWGWKILGMFVMSYAYISIAITGIHEASHLSLSKSRKVNKFWAYVFTEFWTSKSHLWWKWRHIETHHPHTNVIGEEPQPFYFPWMNGFVYFFITPYAVLPWLISSSVWFLRKKPKQLAAYLTVSTLGFLFHASLFAYAGYSWLAALGMVVVMRSIFAPIFLHIAVFNHIGLPFFKNDTTRPQWTELQSKTTRNIRPNWFLKGIGGNAFLDGHVEHHLFPHLSNHQIAKARNTIVNFLKRKQYIYREESYIECLQQCIKHYSHLFEYLKQPLW